MRVEQLQREFPVELDHCAYDLRPGLPPEGLPREEAYRGRSYPAGYLEHLQQTAREAGIDMQRPAIVANTRKAHEATEFARDNGRLGEFARAVFAGYWEQARNISEIDVLCDIGGEAGLDAEALRQALEDGRYAQRVEEQVEWARRAGVSGVPTFVFDGRFAVVGAQDYDVFRDIAGRILRGEVKG